MKIETMAQISIFAVLTAVGAKLMIPLPFVPFSLQTLVVMLAGLLLGSKKGAAAMAVYMIMGLIGLPVFTTVNGPADVLVPSFGYIVGFILNAWASGRICESYRAKYKNLSRTQYFTAAIAGVMLCYLCGIVYLYAALNIWVSSGGATFFKVLSIGLFSTIGADFIKAFAAAIIAYRLEKSGVFRD